MEYLRKHKKIISIIWHLCVYFSAVAVYNVEGFQNLAFAGIFFMNLFNYTAAIINDSFYKKTQDFCTEYRELADDIIVTMKDLQKLCRRQKDEIKELRSMNDRLHEVNQTIVQRRQ